MVGQASSCYFASGERQRPSSWAFSLLARFERDGVHFALQAWIAGHERRFRGLRSETCRIPLPADRIQGCQFKERELLLHLVDGALHVGNRLSQLLVGGFESVNVCSHV